MKVSILRIGNSQGIILPKPLLAQIGLVDGEAEMSVEQDAIVLRKPKKHVRVGWAEASKRLALVGDDALVWPDFDNEGDAEFTW